MNEFETLVAEMRNAQREYFRTRDGAWLQHSRALEAKVDTHLRERRDGQKSLFEGDV